MDDYESVSDSELDLNRDVFDNTPVYIPRKGLQRRRDTVVRRSSIGWTGSLSLANDNSPTIAVQPEKIIELLRSPSVQTYNNLKRKLDKSKNDPEWILNFLNKDGLELLFESLEQICNRQPTSFLNEILKVSCVECVTTVMDSSLGLDYIVENKEFTRKLASALDTDNVAVKKQVYELLSALCVYSKNGYARALDALEHYKVAKKQKYRFWSIVEELRNSTSLPYSTILLEFINCIIIYTDKINERVRIRNEFYGLKLQELLNQLRREAGKDPNLETQLDVFDEHKANDDEQLPGARGVDLNSPLDVFHAIYKQVADTAQELPFLTTLQHLLKIDQSEQISDTIWKIVETLVSKATVVETNEDSNKLLQTVERKFDKFSDKCTCPCHEKDGERLRLTSPRRKISNSVQFDSVEDSNPPPVPPHMTSNSPDSTGIPPPPSTSGAPPPPAPPPPGGALPPPPPPPPGASGAPPPPPPPSGGGGILGFFKPQKKLPQQNTPKPKTKLKSLQWQKIPVNKVMGKNNIWTIGGQLFNGYISVMDYAQMDDLFSVNKATPGGKDEPDGAGVSDKKKKENAEINLLDGKRSLNVNIFLKQFRMSNDEIVDLLRQGASEQFGAEKLKSLQKILPSQEEVDMFRSFDGDRAKLGSAEKFFMCLMGLPNYRLRIDGLLIKEEFKANLEYIKPSIDSVIEAAKDIKENKNLHELLYLVLLAGNYLNAGNYAGDAAGFKLSSLLKLTETRANKPRMNLMHYVVMQAEEKNPVLLNFPDEMKFLKEAAQASVENLTSDINSLTEKVDSAVKNIDSVGRDFKKQMSDFLKKAVEETAELKEDLKDMESLRLELADFFCEDVKTFKLEECFKILQTFCERFTKAKLENDQRKEHERKTEARRLQKEAEQQRKASVDIRTPDGLTPDAAESGKGSIVEMLLADVRSGFKKFEDPNFSVTKVQKVTLENGNVPNTDSETPGDLRFIRGGTGRRSIRGKKRAPVAPDSDTSSVDSFDAKISGTDELNQQGSRRSYAVDTDDTLFDILMKPDSDQTPVSEGNFERIGSLRRRRQNRQQQRSGLNIDVFERERAASPNIEAQSKEYVLKERPKSDIMADDFDFRRGANTGVRRSRSMYDRHTANNSVSETPKTSSDISDRPSRLFDTNNNKSADDKTLSPAFRSDDPTRRSARWRADIPDVKSLPIIDESARLVTPTKDLLKTLESNDSRTNRLTKSGSKDDSDISIEQKNKDKMARRFSTSTFDRKDIERVLNTATDIVEKTDELSTVSVSVRSKINKRWHSDLGKADIDKVLKVIEDTGKKIDEIVKIDENESEQNNDIKQAMTVQTNPGEIKNDSGGETEALKVKRKQRKQRSHLSMDDIHAAFQKKNDFSDDMNIPDKTPSNSVKEGNDKRHAPPPPKSPVVPPRRSRASNENSETLTQEEIENNERNATVSKETMSKAAKLAAKKRFRDQRFGESKDTPAQKAMLEHSTGRWKSNVEKESVDEAFKDYVNKNMSRSKSYDEAVARKLLSESGDLIIPTGEKRNSMRNSSGKLFNDGRRNGKVFDDESDFETNTEGSNSPRRPSSTRSDSPKSSRLSIKSTNTSTETLREGANSDGESSPEQSRKNSIGKRINEKFSSLPSSSSPSFSHRILEAKDEQPSVPPLSINTDITAANVNESTTKNEPRTHVLSKFTDFDENDDLPHAQILKWKKKRDERRRQSYYDNVPESGGLSPKQQSNDSLKHDINSPRSESGHPLILHKSQGSNELQNEIGSRCSYASSSDSARDEGFETMSGTVSQRTSLSSTLDSEFAPNFGKKQEPPMSKLQMNENFIVASAKGSVKDTKIQRTESWTEAVAINADSISKDSSLDSSMEYSATSPDSGLETMKDDTWGEHSDLESTVKRKTSTSSDMSDSKRPMSPASSSGSAKKKNVPSYMRGTTSSSKRTQLHVPEMDRSSSSTNISIKSGRLSRGSISKTGSNTSIVSSVSTTSEVGTSRTRRTSHGTPDRPSSTYSASSRSTTPQPRAMSRSVTPQPMSTPTKTTTRVAAPQPVSTPTKTTTRVAAKPATHATSTVGGRSSRSVSDSTTKTTATTKTTKAKPAPPPPAHRLRTQSLTPNRATTPNPTKMRSQTPNPVSNRPMSPLSTRSVTPSPGDTPVAPSRLKRTQSLRVSSEKRPVFGASPGSKEAPAKTSTPRRSFMEPTAASKARLSLESAQARESPPPTPPPRRSKDTDSIPHKKEEAPSPLKRHASLRLPRNKPGADSHSDNKDKTAEGKIKGFMQKIGGHGSSKVRPESDCTGKLAPVAEGAEGDEQNTAGAGGKSPLKRILGLKGKDKTAKKSPELAKTDAAKKKIPI